MKLFFKVLSWLVLFVAAAGVAFIVLFDPNEYKQEIEQQVNAATGRTLQIDGDISLSILPIGLELGQVELSNAEGFKQPLFARIESLVVKVKLLPLFEQRLEVDALQLEGLWLFLEVDEQGKNNWQDLAERGKGDAAASTSAEDEQATEPAADASLAAIAVSGIEINGADVQYDDRQQGSLIRLSDFKLSTGSIEFGEAFDLALQARVTQKQQDLEQVVAIDLNTDVTIQQSLQQLSLKSIVLALKAKLPQVQEKVLELGLKADLDVDLAAEKVTLDNAVLDAVYAKFILNANVANWSKLLTVSGDIGSEMMNPRELAYRFATELPSMQGQNTLSKLQFRTPFALKGDQLSVQPDILFDESKLNTSFDVNLKTQALRYDINIDSIDINRYMAPAVEETTQAENTEAAPEQDLPIPVELVRSLDVDGSLKIAAAKVLDYEMTNVVVKTRIKDGVANVSPGSFDVLGGHIDTYSSMDVSKQTPVYKHKLLAKNLNIGPVADPILKTLIKGQQVTAVGSGELYADIKTWGWKVSAIKKALNGKFGFEFKDSKLQGLDVDQFVKATVKQALTDKGNPLGLTGNYQERYKPETKTAFDVMKADFSIKDGIASSGNLLMDGSKLRVSGTTRFDLVNMNLDTKVVANRKVVNPQTNEDKLEGSKIPVRVHGPLDALQYDVDYAPILGTLSGIVKDKAKQKVDKAKQKIDKKVDTQKQKIDAKKDAKKEEVKQELKNKLKGLFR